MGKWRNRTGGQFGQAERASGTEWGVGFFLHAKVIPSEIKYSIWTSCINRDFSGKILYFKEEVFHCHVWLPECATIFGRRNNHFLEEKYIFCEHLRVGKWYLWSSSENMEITFKSCWAYPYLSYSNDYLAMGAPLSDALKYQIHVEYIPMKTRRFAVNTYLFLPPPLQVIHATIYRLQ